MTRRLLLALAPLALAPLALGHTAPTPSGEVYVVLWSFEESAEVRGVYRTIWAAERHAPREADGWESYWEPGMGRRRFYRRARLRDEGGIVYERVRIEPRRIED